MSNIRRSITALFTVSLLALGLGACTDTSEADKRTEMQAKKADPNRKTLEKANLAERIKRQEKPNAIGYVYVISFAKPFGYYVIKGKVSSSGSQLTPTDDIVRSCASGGCEFSVVDGAQDDGTFGQNDPGIFFFTSEGTMVETNLDYIYTDQPLDLDVPLLAK